MRKSHVRSIAQESLIEQFSELLYELLALLLLQR
jgi:hypothetical protein